MRMPVDCLLYLYTYCVIRFYRFSVKGGQPSTHIPAYIIKIIALSPMRNIRNRVRILSNDRESYRWCLLIIIFFFIFFRVFDHSELY